MSFIYYVCLAENQKILFESGESSKYRRYAELIVARCAGWRRSFEISTTTPEVILSVVTDLNTTWIAVSDTEVQLTLPFSLLMSLQGPWRSINRPQQFSQVIEDKITLYTSSDEDKQAVVMQEVANFGSTANGVQLEPFSAVLRKNENLDHLLVQLDTQVSLSPEKQTKLSRQRLRFYLTIAAGILSFIWAFVFIACGLNGERCS